MAFRKVLVGSDIGGPDSADSARQKWNANDAEVEAALTGLGAAGGYRDAIVLGSDTSFNTINTWANTGLSVPVVAGTISRFEAHLAFIVATAATCAQTQWGVNGPAFDWLAYHVLQQMGGSGERVVCSEYEVAYSVTTCLTQFRRSTVHISGLIWPSASGTLAIRYRLINQAPSVVVKAGSTLEVW